MFQRLFDEGLIFFYFNAYKCWQYNTKKKKRKKNKILSFIAQKQTADNFTKIRKIKEENN